MYDKFFDSFTNLPNTIQKKVTEFQRKFRKNSKSSAIHLEPISSFKDKTLRSARIDQTYRAIIKIPQVGNTYYLLWVDHHDKAYDWAKNKIFEWNDNTQSMQIFTSPDKINIIQNNKQNAEKSLFSVYPDDKLLKLGVPEILLPSVKKINTLDELEEIEEFIPVDLFENLFYLADGADIDKIIFEIEEGKTSKEHKDTSINNQRSFIELTDDAIFDDILSGNLDKWKYYLHPSQRKLVINDFNGTTKVTGGAGTGKTVAALHRLKYLSEKKENKKPILFTTYTKTLTHNLSKLIKGLGISQNKVIIKNIDAIALQLVKEYNLMKDNFKIFEFNAVKKSEEIWDNILDISLVNYDKDFLIDEYTNVILNSDVKSKEQYLRTSRAGRGKPIGRKQRIELWELFEKYNQQKELLNIYHKEEIYNKLTNFLNSEKIYPYEFCIVDELQDFSNAELRLVRAFVEEKPNDLFLVGDPMQKIYAKNINFSKSGINVRGLKSKRLRINYRTTEEIKKLAISVINDVSYDNFDGEEESKSGYISLFHGEKPSYLVFKTKTEELKYVYNEIQELINQNVNYFDIAVISRTKDGLKEVQSMFHQEKTPYSKYENNDWKGENKGIKLLTFHGIKGLEFQYIFIIDLNSRTCPKLSYNFYNYNLIDRTKYLNNEKSLLYVAISRAIKNVKLSGTGEKSSLIMLNE